MDVAPCAARSLAGDDALGSETSVRHRGGNAVAIVPQPDANSDRKLNMSLAELELSVRATNCLESEGITTVRDLVIRTDDELLEVRNFGVTTLKEVQHKLADLGLRLGMKLPPS
jgi:DNA-directed RNA polymerase subunit alpha